MGVATARTSDQPLSDNHIIISVFVIRSLNSHLARSKCVSLWWTWSSPVWTGGAESHWQALSAYGHWTAPAAVGRSSNPHTCECVLRFSDHSSRLRIYYSYSYVTTLLDPGIPGDLLIKNIFSNKLFNSTLVRWKWVGVLRTPGSPLG